MFGGIQWFGEVNTFLFLAIVIVCYVTLSWMMTKWRVLKAMQAIIKSDVQTADVQSVKNLSSELKTVTAWYNLGINLGLPTYELHKIECDYQGNDRRMLAVLELWLRHTPNAAWEILVDALEEMGENRVAENIRQQYIRRSELQLLSLRDDCWTFDLWGSVPECFMHITFGSTSEDTVKTVSICAAKMCACV